MAAYQPIASRLTLRLQVGADEWGKPKLKSKSIAGVDVLRRRYRRVDGGAGDRRAFALQSGRSAEGRYR
jgi:hypothetical protein